MLLAVVGSISLLVGGIEIMNILLASVTELRVGDVMTRQPVLGAEDSSVPGALHPMREIGVLSSGDVLDALAEELMTVASSIRRGLKVEGALRP